MVQAEAGKAEVQVSSKISLQTPASGFLSGGLEDIVISSDLRRNEGLKACLVKGQWTNKMVSGKNLNCVYASRGFECQQLTLKPYTEWSYYLEAVHGEVIPEGKWSQKEGCFNLPLSPKGTKHLSGPLTIF